MTVRTAHRRTARRRPARSRSARSRSARSRIAVLAAVAVAAIAGLAACGSGAAASAGGNVSGSNPAASGDDHRATETGADHTGGSAAANSSDPAASDDPAAYPIVIPTRYGDVTIPAAPQRVIALTIEAADALLTLGVTPAAVAADPHTFPSSHPWMVGKIDDIANASLVSPTGEVNLEAIAQTKPDLIIGATWLFADAAAFNRMNSIAPTVIANSTALNVNWDERLTATAAAFGRTAEAEHIISEIRAEFAAIGNDVPGIKTKTYQFVRVDPDGYAFGNGSVLELFGLTPAANQDNTQNGPRLSKENTAQLDADLLGVWPPTADLRAALDNDALFQALPAVQNGTVFYADLPLAFAANTPAPMALAWLKDVLAPTIRALG